MIGGTAHPLVLVLSDEEGIFDTGALLDKARVFVQTPKTDDRYGPNVVGFLPVGYSRHVKNLVESGLGPDKTINVGFYGQVTNFRRQVWFDAMMTLDVGVSHVATDGFMQGLPPDEYAKAMARLKVCPAPPGPVTPDTFRLWEALELGAIPLAENFGYWAKLTGPFIRETGASPMEAFNFPCPTVPAASPAGDIAIKIRYEVSQWERHSLIAGSWYKLYKRWLREEFVDQLADRDPRTIAMVSVSPIASHPSTEMIELTIRSIQDQLPDAEILIMCDGVRPEQQERTADYLTHLRALEDKARTDPQWRDVYVCFDGEWRHQAATMLRWMWAVDPADLIVFVEHDAPFRNRKIDWSTVRGLLNGDLAGDVIRFHFEASIPEGHEYLMTGERHTLNDVVLIGTRQWSQRPHIAHAWVYNEILACHFSADSRTMIEDVVYSVFFRQVLPVKIWIYSVPGESMSYTDHLDGRGGEEKYEMWT